MILLNIIPEKLKREIRLYDIYKSTKKLLFVSLIMIIIYIITLLVFKLILQLHFIETVNQTTIITKNTENYTKKVREINQQINSIETIQRESVQWSNLLEFIKSDEENGVEINQIQIDKNNSSIALKGKAKTRDVLLNFKSTLEEKKFFSDINFPIKNLLLKTDIDFEINAKFKSYEFTEL